MTALTGCFIAPKLPDGAVVGNTGSEVTISNLTLSTPWGTEKIELFKSRSVMNDGTNTQFIPLAPKH